MLSGDVRSMDDRSSRADRYSERQSAHFRDCTLVAVATQVVHSKPLKYCQQLAPSQRAYKVIPMHEGILIPGAADSDFVG